MGIVTKKIRLSIRGDKRLRYYAGALLILFSAVGAGIFFINTTASGAVKIDDASNIGHTGGPGRKIVRTPGGTLYSGVIDGDGVDNYFEIWKSTDSGSTWTEQDSSNKPGSAGSSLAVDAVYHHYDIAIDGSGVIHAVFLGCISTCDGSDLAYLTFNTSNDSFAVEEEAIDCPTSEECYGAGLSLDSNGKPHALTSSFDDTNGDVTVTYNQRVSGSWDFSISIETIAANTIPVTIAVNEDNIAEVTYVDPVGLDLTAAVANSNTPSTFTIHDIDTNVPATSLANIAVDSEGNTWIAYVDENGATDYITLVKHNDADGWTTWQTPITNSNAGSSPSIAINGTDIYVFYENDTDDVAYDKYSASWNGEVTLQTGTYEQVAAKWSLNFNNQGGTQIDYLFSDGTDVYWDKLSLAGTVPAFVSASSGTGSYTNEITINKPSSIMQGDVMIALIGTAASSNAVNGVTSSGWTAIRGDSSGLPDVNAISLYKVAGSSEPTSYTFAFTLDGLPADGSFLQSSGVVAAYRSANTTTPVNVDGGLAGLSAQHGANGNVKAPSVTSTVNNTRVLALYTTDGGELTGTFSPASGTTERAEAFLGGPDAGLSRTMVADFTQASAGATGDKTATYPENVNMDRVGQQVVLSPATGNSAPGSPTLSAPSSGATGVSTLPQFQFAATDTESDYLRYEIIVYQSDCSTVVRTIDQTASQTGWSGQNAQTSTAYTSGTTAAHTYQTTALANSTTYCWKARATDPGGTNTWGSYSGTRTFTTTGTSSAVLIEPSASATGVRGYPTFRLRASDPENNYLQYKFDICTVSDCSAVARTIDQTASQTGWSGQDANTGTAYVGNSSIASSTIASHLLQPPGLSANTQYWWRVYWLDPAGSNTWSPPSSIQTFTTTGVVNIEIRGGSTIQGGGWVY